VFLVQDSADKQIYALKTICLKGEELKKSAEAEIALLSSMNHAAVVRCYRTFLINHEPENTRLPSAAPYQCIVMEFCGTTLENLIKTCPQLPLDVVLPWFLDLLEGLAYVCCESRRTTVESEGGGERLLTERLSVRACVRACAM
jgi:serine/threonine protein kinase